MVGCTTARVCQPASHNPRSVFLHRSSMLIACRGSECRLHHVRSLCDCALQRHQGEATFAASCPTKDSGRLAKRKCQPANGSNQHYQQTPQMATSRQICKGSWGRSHTSSVERESLMASRAYPPDTVSPPTRWCRQSCTGKQQAPASTIFRHQMGQHPGRWRGAWSHSRPKSRNVHLTILLSVSCIPFFGRHPGGSA